MSAPDACPMCGADRVERDLNWTEYACGSGQRNDYPAPGSARTHGWKCDERRLEWATRVIEALVSPRIGADKKLQLAAARQEARKFIQTKSMLDTNRTQEATKP